MEALIPLKNVSMEAALHSEGRLSVAESRELTVLLDQMAAHYPHQQLTDETAHGYRCDIERLAVRWGMIRVKWALAELRIKPGMKFFPHPSEIAEQILDTFSRQLESPDARMAFVSCGSCCDGWIVEKNGNGGTLARRCKCVAEYEAMKRVRRESALANFEMTGGAQ